MKPKAPKVFKLSPEETRRAINELARLRAMARMIQKRAKFNAEKIIKAGGGCSQKWQAQISHLNATSYMAHKAASTRVVLKPIPDDAVWAKS